MRKSLLHIFEDTEPVEEGNILKSLRQYVKGTISAYDLEYSDDFIKDISEKYNKGQSQIELNIKLEEFMEKIGLDDEDIYFYKMVNNTYSDFQFNDWTTFQDDFDEGYNSFYTDLDADNLESFKEIAGYIYPAEQFDLNNTDYLQELNKRLRFTFGGEIEDIVGEYYHETERAFMISARKTVEEEFGSSLEEYGFIFNSYYDTIWVKVADLIKDAYSFNYTGNLEGLYNLITDKMSVRGGWMQDYYSLYDHDNFDKDSFNRDVYRNINRILEYIEDNSEKLKEFQRFVTRITKKFPTNRWITLPKDNRISFSIQDFDMENMTISIVVRGLVQVVNRKFSEEDFYNFLYHPELFDLDY